MKELYQIFLTSNGVQTDTRKIIDGQLFYALSGENFDGNTYVEQALSKGAIHAVSSDLKWENDSRVTVVKDTLKNLQQLATYHRKKINIPILSLTGSNGKTTTKELIISVLRQQFNVKGTAGNLNNHIGVPLTLLSFNESTDIGIVEMGANHLKEIETLSNITLPDYGLITNYGKAHLEGFGSEENIRIGKSELFEHLRKHNKTAIVGHWDKEQLKRSKGIERFLTSSDSKLIKAEPYISLEFEGKQCDTQLVGEYNYHNMLLAAAVGQIFNMSTTNIIKGLAHYTPNNNRSQIIQKGNLKIILDAYNANPSSMVVALKNLSKQSERKKIAILGDMFELGTYSTTEHQNIAELTQQLQIDQTYLIGEAFSKVNCEQAQLFENLENFNKQFNIDKTQESVLLIKGSRGMALERILEIIK
ncbi:UDP-N-acetylmuramoyl-tripeptide--D-alanyl-D-alanine ligase [Nonlabens ulvanivorans]|uniref:UDP-N-acetylmuramoyl-tripeptide--D-alanyl-D-alanine ligase n=1 Tax=Nonlabens ulvanivorans TaxID=906888 RepID=A0A084JSS5_NONUL|nr:UDP-N-acetylmuramoyl-tripeptide--D-alanyl-D-alanine ligase [Nonlabens ulvanivorans]KEZ92009.1 UDP-N-acetylmuramoyl-tripeptide (MurF) [Nonlabens ulvanivorans]PRX14837.1 UDP-N-acetylmuramoyl-tripeptide--D-alanyl-D-alanine ligase [Nonlabens ulvanivorans]